MGRKKLDRKRRVLYCESDLSNAELVELIENGSVSAECRRCPELELEITELKNRCAQQKPVTENKSAQIPKEDRMAIALAALNGAKVSVPDADDEEFVTPPRMPTREAQLLVNEFVEIMKSGATFQNCKFILGQLRDTVA